MPEVEFAVIRATLERFAGNKRGLRMPSRSFTTESVRIALAPMEVQRAFVCCLPGRRKVRGRMRDAAADMAGEPPSPPGMPDLVATGSGEATARYSELRRRST